MKAWLEALYGGVVATLIAFLIVMLFELLTATPVAGQSLDFNSSLHNPLGLPTISTPTIPDCDTEPEHDDCAWVPDYDGTDTLVRQWQLSCRQWCPWDYDAWLEAYGYDADDCGFFESCEDLPPMTATPEPATLALLATGLAGVGAAYRRRRRK